MTIGENIRAYRKRRGLTQAQLGALCGKTGGAVGSYEKGTTVPKRRVVEAVAAALDVPVDKLLERPAPAAPAAAPSDAPLYDGVLSALKELYGVVEGRVVVGENGASRKYYVVKRPEDSFVLHERDIAAIARSVEASMAPLAARMGQAGRSV